MSLVQGEITDLQMILSGDIFIVGEGVSQWLTQPFYQTATIGKGGRRAVLKNLAWALNGQFQSYSTSVQRLDYSINVQQYN